MKKVIIAMSGGVDSSVAAKIITDKEYDCIGATMKLFDENDILLCENQSCTTKKDIEDANSVANSLKIPYYVFNFKGEFKEKVIDKFISTYEDGGTPNPCIDCNKNLKFSALFKKAKELGCDYIVTGHYVSVEKKGKRYALKKAKDLKKDQSYVLYSLSQEELSHTIFPLGNLSKEEVRKIADECGFNNANKKESQDICFVPNGNYASFIEKFTNKKYENGNFVDKSGNILGEHKGIIRYTIGQRKGLGLALCEPMYVCKKDLSANTVTLCKNEELFEKEVFVKNFNWVSIENPNKPFKAKAKIRYNMKEADCEVIPSENNEVKIIFDEPQRAITKGQSAVVYNNDYVIGGGTIK